MPALCHRCHRDLPTLSGDRDVPHTLDNVLLFCPHCAAPQIRLPEYSQTPHPLTASTGALPPPLPAGQSGAFSQAAPHVNWRAGLRACGLVAGVSAVATLVCFAGNGAVANIAAFVTELLVIGGAALAVALYAQFAQRAHLTLRRGLALGLVTGVLNVALTGLLLSAAGVIARFVLRSADFNLAVEQQFAAWRQAWSVFIDGQPNAAVLMKYVATHMASPEYRAGMVLGEAALFAVLIVLISGLSGAAAGLLRTPRKRLPQ